MQKKARELSFVLFVLMLFAILTGCGSQAMDGNAEESQDSSEETGSDELPGGFKVEKIGSIAVEDVNCGYGGLIYLGENEKYGIMTFDGKKVTDAKYTFCEAIGNCFLVSTVDEESVSVSNAQSMNCLGVVDGKGNEIIPMKYAMIDWLSERYYCAYEVTEQTDDKKEALLAYGYAPFGLIVGDSIYFNGKWEVYDMIAGKKLDGVSGTENGDIRCDNRFITYSLNRWERITVDYTGEEYPENTHSISDSYYAVENSRAGTVYDFDHNKIFDYDLDGFIPYYGNDSIIIGKKDTDDEETFALMDTAGQVISPEYATCPIISGDLIAADGKIFNLAGDIIFEGPYTNVYFEEHFGNACIIENDDSYTVIDREGTVLYQQAEEDTIHYHDYSLAFFKEIYLNEYYYSFADKDFTLSGSYLTTNLIEVSRYDGTYDVVDVLSGETIIHGYKRYVAKCDFGYVIYVYAEKADGGFDIYTVGDPKSAF